MFGPAVSVEFTPMWRKKCSLISRSTSSYPLSLSLIPYKKETYFIDERNMCKSTQNFLDLLIIKPAFETYIYMTHFYSTSGWFLNISFPKKCLCNWWVMAIEYPNGIWCILLGVLSNIHEAICFNLQSRDKETVWWIFSFHIYSLSLLST